MKQHTPGNIRASRQWNDKVFYVQNIRGDGGKDWGYTTDPRKALLLNGYFALLFEADCNRVGATANFLYGVSA